MRSPNSEWHTAVRINGLVGLCVSHDAYPPDLGRFTCKETHAGRMAFSTARSDASSSASTCTVPAFPTAVVSVHADALMGMQPL